MLDLPLLQQTAVTTSPFPYLIIPQFVTKDACDAINADFPEVHSAGSFPLSSLKYGSTFQDFMRQIQGPEFRKIVEEKFQVSLDNLPTLVTVRGKSQARDGRIHIDTKTKVITVLIYMNASWEPEGGRLRLLNSSKDIHDYFAEVPPVEGTMIAFKVTPDCWHGHLPFIGERRVIQLNWITSQQVVDRMEARHGFSAKFKKLKNWLGLSEY
jgi:SM-20-related protein